MRKTSPPIWIARKADATDALTQDGLAIHMPSLTADITHLKTSFASVLEVCRNTQKHVFSLETGYCIDFCNQKTLLL